MAQANPSWQGKTVLVVDDYPAVRKTVRELLQSLGLNTLEADNGLKALEILRSEPVDLLVSDLVMPEMDGFELTETVKNDAALRKTPVVIISTHADAKYIFRALRLGADDYLTKPPSAEMAALVLTRIFDHDW